VTSPMAVNQVREALRELVRGRLETSTHELVGLRQPVSVVVSPNDRDKG